MNDAALGTRLEVQALELSDFRGLSSLGLQCTNLNVILGVNGAGKTTLLYSLAIVLSRLSSRIATGKTAGLRLDDGDIRNEAKQLSIDVKLSYDGEPYNSQLTRSRRSPTKQLVVGDKSSGLNSLASKMRQVLEDMESTSVPILLYMPVNRAVFDIPLRIRTRHTFDQFSAYDGAFEARRHFRTFFEWFREREDYENEQRIEKRSFRDRQLSAVRNSIEQLMDGYTDLRVRRNPLRMWITKEAEELQVNQLSDGEKTLLATIGELARRLATANPGAKEPLSGFGIVLIDELDLHLHPRWQRQLVQRLPKVFPNLQFFLTTHSPVIAGAVKPEHLFVLSDGVIKNAEAYGQDVGLILSDIFDTPRRLEGIQTKLDNLFRLIYDEHQQAAQTAYEGLVAEIGGNDPELVRARTLLRRFGAA